MEDLVKEEKATKKEDKFRKKVQRMMEGMTPREAVEAMMRLPPDEREEGLKTMKKFMEMEKSKMTPEQWEEAKRRDQ
jgi:hypothetical protein